MSTDHGNLKWLLMSADSLGKIARWLLRLLGLDFEVDHRNSNKPHVSVALSWHEAEKAYKTKLDGELPALIVDDSEEQQDVKRE